MFNWIKNNFISKESKTIVSERTDGMDFIQEYSDGSFLITTNKTHGSIDGIHYTGYVEHVRQLKREKRYNEAIELLLKLVDATERESKLSREAWGDGWGVAPWYYRQLAIIYRKEKRYNDEVSILERYENQQKAPGVTPAKLAERLIKAKELARKHIDKM